MLGCCFTWFSYSPQCTTPNALPILCSGHQKGKGKGKARKGRLLEVGSFAFHFDLPHLLFNIGMHIAKCKGKVDVPNNSDITIHT